MASEEMFLILAGVVRDFVESGATRSRRWFIADDIAADDPVAMPDGKCVKVMFEYAPEHFRKATTRDNEVFE